MRVLISGAGIAGPTLAYWLLRNGFTPMLIELLGIAVRNLATRAMKIPAVAELTIGRSLRDDLIVPNYETSLTS